MERSVSQISLPEKIAGFECDTDIENVRFHIVLTAGAFLPNPTIRSLPHNHPVFEGHLILNADTTMVTPAGSYLLEKNDFCLLPPRMYHHAREKDVSVSSIAFSFSYTRISTEDLADLYSTLDETLSSLAEPLVFSRAFPLAHALFELTEEMGRGALGKANRLATKTAEVVFALLDLICPQARGDYKATLSAATRQQLTIDSFFARNYMHDVTIHDLADVIYLSARQTNRVLLELYGLTFKQKLIETRIQTAMQFLQFSDRSVGEIVQQSGYRSAVGFHSAFRQMTGMTPAKYRSMMRKMQTKSNHNHQ